VIADRDWVGVAPEVSKNGPGSAERRLGIDDPVLVKQRVDKCLQSLRLGQRGGLATEDELVVGICLAQSFHEPSAKDPTAHLHREEESVLGMDPAPMIGRQSSSRNHAVHVGMQHQILSPRMKAAEKPDLGTQMLPIGSELEQGFRAGAEQEVVEQRGVSSAKRIQLVGQGKDHMEVRHAA
jgi:hypothetical protein